MKTAQQQLDTVEQLSAIVFAPQKNGADYYKRVVEMIDFIDGYFCMNICPQDAADMTLKELKALLEPKIEFFSKYVASDKVGVFVRAEES